MMYDHRLGLPSEWHGLLGVSSTPLFTVHSFFTHLDILCCNTSSLVKFILWRRSRMQTHIVAGVLDL